MEAKNRYVGMSVIKKDAKALLDYSFSLTENRMKKQGTS